ncbi:aromatic amino acid exporter YddG [Ferrovibrio sp.]|uniref:aromatic amino acid exporter YddG n=1 Tax=Ferrovibrio sp. TaxID=1917215 RepID=UPI003D2A605A
MPTDTAARLRGTRTGATLIGACAILLWSSLALLTTFTGAVPPLQLTGMTFSIAALLAFGSWIARRENPLGYLRQPVAIWALGIFGLFGYHALYFIALKFAPPVEASLINYLWPLLIVAFSALLPSERLRWFHSTGVLLGLCGTVVLFLGKEIAFDPAHLPGFLAAFACAFTWSIYSVLCRRVPDVPTGSIGGFCAAAALLAWIGHGVWETTLWPSNATEWLAVLALGLGPAGGAFFLWDIGMKRGDIRALGAMAYGTPLLSTLLLILFGKGAFTWQVATACLLIAGGAVLGAGDLRKKAA